MPSSHCFQISKIIEKVMELNPQSILDIGCGFGKYGVLCREYLEYWGNDAALNWKRKIDAIEAFPEYITPLHRFIYNNIWTEDIRKILDKCVNYDLVLFIDVLEHFHKPEGAAILEHLLKHNKGILISTPRKFAEQTDVFGNEYERHKSIWTEEELRVFGNAIFIQDERSVICHITH